ncbi:MAG: sugar phosphate isomerase/epimerase [Planctomycetes bacterium]|nr:sugar phosphate isomerase/epimerase [Planctomycetota bacterium]
MQLGLINSAWVQTGQPVEFGLRKTKELGFDCIDIFVDPLELDVRERRLIARECRRLELPIVSLPCVALGLIDPFGAVRRFHEQRVAAYLDLAYEYEAKNLLLVLGEYVWNREVIPATEQWQWGVGALQRLGHRASELGLEIVLELEPFHNSLLNNIDRMKQFLDDVAVPSVKANIDVSHLVLSKCAPEELRKLRGRAGHVHLSDCDGRMHGDLPPGRGVVPFEPYLREIKALDINGAISIELEYAPQPDKIVEWVAEAYRETDKLMQAVGLRG